MIAARRLAPLAAPTRHPLPAHDPAIAALTADERAVVAAVWHGRSEAELRASGSFAYIADTLAAAGAHGDLVALARRAVSDEVRHSELCARVAAAYADAPLPAPRKLEVTIPRHAGANRALRRVLHVVGMSCFNETTGSAFLELCRERATGALVRAALRELLTDEIDHARIGWAFVATLEPAARIALGQWLPELCALNLRAWRDRPQRPISDALPAHGCPRWDEVDATVLAAIKDLVVPGFARLGIDVAPAQRWFATAATLAA